MALIDSILVFVVGLAIGGIGIYAAARILTGRKDFGYAVATGIIGAIVWSLMAFFVGNLPWLSSFAPIVALIAWIAVIKSRYRGGWIAAGFIGFMAWIIVLLVLYLLASIGIIGFSAVGIPGL